MKLDDLIQTLAALPQDVPVVFSIDEVDVSGGYHLTELKHAQVTSLDCAARAHAWTELRVQLLDGAGGAHMTVGRMRSILTKSVAHLPNASSADLLVEYATGNKGLGLYSLDKPEIQSNAQLDLRLIARRATCKPAAAFDVAAYPGRATTIGQGCCG